MSNEINIEELEQSASEVKGWRCDCSWTDRSDGIPVSVVGTIDEEGNKHPVVFVNDDQCLCGDSGSLADFYAIANPNAVLALIDRLKKAEAELERERTRLAACGVVAMADTKESAYQVRKMVEEYRSASFDDVARRVDECMALRAERDALVAKLAELEGQEPVAFGNRDELDDILADRHCLVTGVRSGFHRTPLYARPVPTERPVNARLLAIATGQLQHTYAGLCPDPVSTPNSRDPECPACRVITAAERLQSGSERLNVDDLSNFIRAIDGNHQMGAGQLAENIAEYLTRNGIEVAE